MAASHALTALSLSLLLLPVTAQEAGAPEEERPDLRDAYDVEAYRLDIRGDPEEQRVQGTSFIEAKVGAHDSFFAVLTPAAGRAAHPPHRFNLFVKLTLP